LRSLLSNPSIGFDNLSSPIRRKRLQRDGKQHNIKYGPLKRFIIYLLTYAMIGLGIFAMFIIAANKTVTEQRAWSGYFAFFIIQDILVNPLLYMILHYSLTKMVRMHQFKMNPTLHYKLYSQLNRELEEIYVIFI
jgi:hypothetical protein